MATPVTYHGADGRVADSVSDDSPLMAILGSVSGDHYDHDNHGYFKLTGVLSTNMVIQGVPETSTKPIQYAIRSRNGPGIIPRNGAGVPRISNSFLVPDELQRDITFMATRNTALPKVFRSMSLSGVAERLASGMSRYAMFGALTPAELRGGGGVILNGLSASTDNIAVGPANVFVSKRDADHRYPATECALFNAIAGEGGAIYSDLVHIDGNGIAQMSTYQGPDLARGCYAALMQIGRMMCAAGAGPSFSLAVFRGVTKSLTVAGHSDEGGHVRHVMRAGCYEAPYGAVVISGDTGDYTGMPTPGPGITSFRRLVFSIAIGGAAGSACSDPMVRFDDIDYPTTVVDVHGGTEDPGVPADALEGAELLAQGERMRAKWFGGCGIWAYNYVYFLARLFACKGDILAAQSVLSASASHTVHMPDRHLERSVAIAYCWIEPTSVVPFWDAYLPAMAADCGPLASSRRSRVVPAMRSTFVETEEGGLRYATLGKYAYPRRHGLIVHLTEHAMDGLGAIRLFSGSSSHFSNVGGQGAMDQRIMNGAGLDTLAWGRLHNMLPAVGECLDMNPTLRLLFTQGGVPATDQFGWAPTHIPRPDELSLSCVYTASRPIMHRGQQQLGEFPRGWVRARTAAARALDCNARLGMDSQGWGGSIRPMLGTPMYGRPQANPHDPVAHMLANNVAYETVPMYDPGVEPSGEASATRAPRNTVAGLLVPLVIQHVADRGRRAPRPQVRGAAGGGRGPGGGGAGGGGPNNNVPPDNNNPPPPGNNPPPAGPAAPDPGGNAGNGAQGAGGAAEPPAAPDPGNAGPGPVQP